MNDNGFFFLQVCLLFALLDASFQITVFSFQNTFAGGIEQITAWQRN